LGEGAGRQDALAFAAGEGGVVAVREGADSAAFDRLGHGLAVLGAVPAHQSVMGRKAQGDDLGHGKAGRGAGFLEDGRRAAGGGARGQLPYVVAAPP
jgi:hypothetical protein